MKPLEMVAGVVVGLVGALTIDLYGVPGLIVVTLLLLVAIVIRSASAALATAIASAVTIALWALAITRCDRAIQDCTVEAPQLILSGWLVLILVVGVAATLRLVARSRPR